MSNNVNSTQVQSTNGACIISKCSAASQNYFNDIFIEHFVPKKKLRASLINLGYYTRTIVSCGAGFDTTFWKLSEAKLLNNCKLFVEIDFPSIVRNSKISNQSVNQLSSNYILVEADLSKINELETIFNDINIEYNIPTLFLSECVITYMHVEKSNQLLEWIAKKFQNGAFINYEQIHPNDGFGTIMLKHFDKLQSSLFSVKKYPDCDSHYLRYKNLGFQNNVSLSEWDAFMFLTTENERQNAYSKEIFDEFEEFHNKCVHYVVGIAGNQKSSEWIDSLPFYSLKQFKDDRKRLILNYLESNIELFRHSSFKLNKGKYIYLVGGSKSKKRNSDVFRIDLSNNLNSEIINVITNNIKVQLDRVYGSLTNFRLKESNFCCMYGGRTSPSVIANNGSLVLFEILNDSFILKLIIPLENITPLYRSSLISCTLNDNQVECLIFGGRSGDINVSSADLIKLNFSLNDKNNLDYSYKVLKKTNENWPCCRMSQSMACWERNKSVLMSCGMKINSKWDCTEEKWEQVNIKGNVLPRYGHTSHIINDELFLIGGVNTLTGLQPGISKINLNNLTAIEYSLEARGPHPVLFFNHSTEVIEEKNVKKILILGGGGNCFSFGTYLNQGIYSINLNEFS
ncbi:leucine carboxyl methyltransferase, putative [Pediculus humanus corporis]|uniref:tRNA wybutosine-synthesizing protein 4 n=1 Tax=Pediculus humanus subsp. corporis TaxID=121224 RepID=E0VAV6_PEDHC|nr:leucine carboxyl methyltransferase, putative [Pediculus humanus corporis]EEB10512.1 leucine carboxyl methyltransferase, putative [Pediculus humanus corporis]